MINTVLFDFDGTLINTNDVIVAAWQHTYRKYLGHEMPLEHITRCFGEPLLLTMAREFPAVPPEESAEVYRTHQREMADELVRLFPQTEEMLRSVRDAGYKIGVVTSRTADSTKFYMDKFGIAGYFDAIVSCDDTDKHKPDPEPVLLGLAKLNASREEAIMVGDSFFDIRCANNAGVSTVLVDWRITGSDDKLADCRVDYRLAEPLDMIRVLEKANQKSER